MHQGQQRDDGVQDVEGDPLDVRGDAVVAARPGGESEASQAAERDEGDGEALADAVLLRVVVACGRSARVGFEIAVAVVAVRVVGVGGCRSPGLALTAAVVLVLLQPIRSVCLCPVVAHRGIIILVILLVLLYNYYYNRSYSYSYEYWYCRCCYYERMNSCLRVRGWYSSENVQVMNGDCLDAIYVHVIHSDVVFGVSFLGQTGNKGGNAKWTARCKAQRVSQR
mmetsp:Transcript_13291/g.36727  ORF Transcript_13291/g.36727 Transcript_13291/m.36727 type:complete len:224 (-) Transcript_13291:139-810(-)